MAFAFRLPDLGEGVAKGEVVRWHVRAGQPIAEDEPLVDVDSDKALVEITSPVTGTVSRILVGEGQVVPVGTVLVTIETVDESVADAPAGVPAVAASAKPAQPNRREPVPGAAEPGVERLRLTGVRRHVAERVARAHEVPTVTVVDECDFTDLRASTTGYGYLATLVFHVARALREHPRLNATFVADELLVHERCDIGLAVETRRGLVVPVVRGAEAADVDQLAREVRRVVRAARDDVAAVEDLRGSTFTITDAGGLGGLFATPLVNVPEVAILGVHRVTDRPAVRAGRIEVRKLGYLSCSFDHRVVDGAEVGRFLRAVIAGIEAEGEPT